jgi:GNAT superfamily N-acetyltransferase
MKFSVRSATLADVDVVVALLRDYMQETYGRPWHGSRGALIADGFGARFKLMVAEASANDVVAFAAWQLSYDLHHCLLGADVLDMFVAPSHRGLALPVILMASVAAQSREAGAVFLKGQAVPKAGVQNLYERIAMAFPGADCIVGGRAFRALAELAGQPPRFVVQHLPDKSWNYEA